MTSRTRNLTILGIVAALLVLALLVIIPGTPLSKNTQLGLDLEGGVELVYEGEPTPQVPKVTPQAIDDAIETIRKRTDALGVSEPEIQRAGARPDLGRPAGREERRARGASRSAPPRSSSSTTGSRTSSPTARSTRAAHALFDAVSAASTQKGKAEANDIPPAARTMTPAQADKRQQHGQGPATTCSAPTRLADRARQEAADRTGSYEPSGDLQGPARPTTRPAPGPAPEVRQGHGVPEGARGARLGRPAGRLARDQGARGHRGGRAGAGAQPAAADPPLHGARGRLRAVRLGHQGPEGRHRPEHERADRDDRVHRQGARGVRARDQADRRARLRAVDAAPGATDKEQFFQHFAITLDNQIVSLATIDFIENPEGIDGRTGAQINVGDFNDAKDLAESLRIGALPIELKLISKTQVSATLGKQALHQGLIAGAVGLLLTILFLLALLPRARPGRDGGAADLRDLAVRAGQADPDHADAAGHRGPDPDAWRSRPTRTSSSSSA